MTLNYNIFVISPKVAKAGKAVIFVVQNWGWLCQQTSPTFGNYLLRTKIRFGLSRLMADSNGFFGCVYFGHPGNINLFLLFLNPGKSVANYLLSAESCVVRASNFKLGNFTSNERT
jgi:hypothetical protein